MKIPAFINPDSGTADRVRKVLANHSGIDLYEMQATDLRDAVDNKVREGAKRIIVSGGDGTIALCASRMVGTDTRLAIIPGGTLNHFALRHNIPLDAGEALEVALADHQKKVDVAYVNDHLFINTSSVGAYVHFVHTRDQLQGRMNYHTASLVAGVHRLIKMRSAYLDLSGKVVRTPLVFIGVGERVLQFPEFGAQSENGEDKLHVVAIKSNGKLETLKIAFKAMLLGVEPLSQQNQLESVLLDEIQIDIKKSKKEKIIIAVDGELLALKTPLKYRYAASELNLLVP